MTAADICRERGWVVGDVLVGDEGYGYDAIEIRAIGRRNILAARVASRRDGEWWFVETPIESAWSLGCRDWTKATPEQLAAIRPPADPAVTTYGPTEPGVFMVCAVPDCNCGKPLSMRTEHGHVTLEGEHRGRQWPAQNPDTPVRRLTIPEVCTRLLGCDSPEAAARAMLEGLPFSVVEHDARRTAVGLGYEAGEYAVYTPTSRVVDADGLQRIVSQGAALLDREQAPAEIHLTTEQNRAVANALVASVEPSDFVSMCEPSEQAPADGEDRTKPAPGYLVDLRRYDTDWLWALVTCDGALVAHFFAEKAAVARSWKLHDEEAGR